MFNTQIVPSSYYNILLTPTHNSNCLLSRSKIEVSNKSEQSQILSMQYVKMLQQKEVMFQLHCTAVMACVGCEAAETY